MLRLRDSWSDSPPEPRTRLVCVPQLILKSPYVFGVRELTSFVGQPPYLVVFMVVYWVRRGYYPGPRVR